MIMDNVCAIWKNKEYDWIPDMAILYVVVLHIANNLKRRNDLKNIFFVKEEL